jgi:hypothetical protein
VLHRRTLVVALVVLAATAAFPATLGGPLPGPLPLFPPTNWWNLDISAAPVDPSSAAYISFIGGGTQMHPDFGGEVSPGSTEIYGFPYIVVDGTQAKKTVQFLFSEESDGVDHDTNTSFPFYPIPNEAITEDHWIEGGWPGDDPDASGDRHMLIVDATNKHLYELYNVFYDGVNWRAGSGAFFDMNTNNRRPEGWTSADAAGLAILPGLVRHDEVYGTAEIGHAFRVTVSSTNGYVYPASHEAGDTPGALPMGARLRLKAGTDISSYPAEMQRVFRAMKKHGLIVADNGSDMYVSGTFDTQWDNDVLNPAFHSLHASDFEVIQLGYNPPLPTSVLSIGDASVKEGNGGITTASVTVTLSPAASSTVTVGYATANGTALAGSDYVAASGTVTFLAGQTSKTISVGVIGDTIDERNEALLVALSSPVNATLARATGQVTILDDDGRPALCIPILTVPFTITAQGNYCLVRNLSTAQTTGAAITVASDFVVLDLKGFKIGGGAAGPGTETVGVHALNRRNVAVRNGNLRGFLQGVFLQDTSGTFSASQGHLVEGIRADENTYSGIHVQGRGNVVRRNQVVTTTGTTVFGPNSVVYGIASEGPGGRVLDNDVTDTVGVGTGEGLAIAVDTGNGSVVERSRIGNSSLGNSVGIRIAGSTSVLVLRNRLAVLGSGIEYVSSTGSFRDNLASGVSVPYTGGTDAGNNQ